MTFVIADTFTDALKRLTNLARTICPIDEYLERPPFFFSGADRKSKLAPIDSNLVGVHEQEHEIFRVFLYSLHKLSLDGE